MLHGVEMRVRESRREREAIKWEGWSRVQELVFVCKSISGGKRVEDQNITSYEAYNLDVTGFGQRQYCEKCLNDI